MQKKIFIGLILTLVIIVFIAVYWATEPARQEAARQRIMHEAIEMGAETYISFCAACHGQDGSRIPGAALNGITLDDSVLRKTISRGVPLTTMPAFGIDDGGPLEKHRIYDVVAFLKNWDDELLSEIPEEDEPAVETTDEPEDETPASIDAAGLYGTRCGFCHGAQRQGIESIAPALTPESLADLTDVEIRNITVNGLSGTAMPAFRDIISAEEIEALLRFIKDTTP